MVTPPPWMSLIAPDPLPLDQQPSQVREVVDALGAAGVAGDYAGAAGDTDVFLVRGERRHGRLVINRSRGSIELWSNPADPNGAPVGWAYDVQGSWAAVAVDVVHRGWAPR